MWRDAAWLLDILLAARRIRDYTDRKSGEDFSHNPILQDAVVRQFEIMGEAARNVSDETRAAHPDIPWRDMVAFRNRLLHAYFQVNTDKVWEVVQREIPPLIESIQPLVPPEGKR